jgi:glycosyltransferase involved in cell wall biosynthesis
MVDAVDQERALLVSVIVPVWNNARQLETCLHALSRQTLPRQQFEIIVVDNGSTDDTLVRARSLPDVTVISEPRAGSYIARNSGARIARGEYLAFTDSDCVPDPKWLEAATDAARANASAGLLLGPIRLFDETGDGSRVYHDYETLFSFPQDPVKGNCATANWMSPKALILGLGGFEEETKSLADKGMAMRIKEAGKALVFVPEMVVHHPVRATMGEILNKRLRMTGGRWSRSSGAARLPKSIFAVARETAFRLRKVRRAPDLAAMQRLSIAALLLWLGMVSSLELVRLALGGKPVR